MCSAFLAEYEFIVVGAGASGCTVASRLAKSEKRPQVLLVEAGGKNDNKEWRIDANRWVQMLNPAQNWGYTTVPQKHLNGRQIEYHRGKGLGGSTAINFSAWNIGPSADHDEIAQLVGDNEWCWGNALKRYIRLESYHGNPLDVPHEFEKYLQPDPKNHGQDGPIRIGFPVIWELAMKEQMDTFIDAGYRRNPDLNSGDPIGISIAPSSAYKGVRSTAADQLHNAPDNLHIMTDTQVARITFDGDKATGIENLDGRHFRVSKEVVLSAGSLDTPRILMHSGIGPEDQLDRFQIPIRRANANIGQNLKDHYHISPTWQTDGLPRERMEFYRSKELQAAARSQWELDQTGKLAEIGCVFSIGMLKCDEIYGTPEFKALPERNKAHMKHSTVPSFEVAVYGFTPELFLEPDLEKALFNIFIFLMNPQSVGSVTLQSSDPSVPLRFDPNFFSHPYDRRLAVEATRQVLKLVGGNSWPKDVDKVYHAPASDSEEDILHYWQQRASSTWHMTGTCKMGKTEDEDGACVDKDFKLMGVQDLRIADMSVVPLMPNNHTQTTACLVGLMAGDRLVADYALDA